MTNLQNVRKANLEILIEKYGNKRSLERETGTSAGYLSHVTGGRRELGEILCRRIEAALNLKEGWMDQRH